MAGEKSHAVQVLRDAVEQCYDQDMRTQEVYEALDYLSTYRSKRSALVEFRQALDISHPEQRQLALRHYLKRIVREFES